MAAEKTLIGSVAFYYGRTLVDESPLYEGESVDGREVMERAERAVRLLDVPPTGKAAMLGRAVRVFYPSPQYMPLDEIPY